MHSPVKKVNYLVEAARLGQTTDYDKLTLDVWTNGSVTPRDAVSLSAKLIRDHLNIFINLEDAGDLQQDASAEHAARRPLNENLDKSVEELELSVRSYNCLKNANIRTIRELVQKTEGEMLKTKNFGRKSLNEIKEILSGDGPEPRHAARPADGAGARVTTLPGFGLGIRDSQVRRSMNPPSPSPIPTYKDQSNASQSQSPETGPRHRASHRDAAQSGGGAHQVTSASRRRCRRRRSCGRSSSGSSPSPSAALPPARRTAARCTRAGSCCATSRTARSSGKLFDTIAPRFEARPGGYTRILRLGYRRGDSAEVAQIELVGSEYNPNAETEKAEAAEAKKPKGVGGRLRAAAARLRGKKAEAGGDETARARRQESQARPHERARPPSPIRRGKAKTAFRPRSTGGRGPDRSDQGSTALLAH